MSANATLLLWHSDAGDTLYRFTIAILVPNTINVQADGLGSVTASGTITSGYHTLTITDVANTVTILLDGVIKAVGAFSGGVPDYGGPWHFVQEGSMPYMESLTIQRSGVNHQVIRWLYSDNFTDLSGNGHWATPTFRTASSHPLVSGNLSAFSPMSEAQAPGYSVAGISGDIVASTNVSANFTTADVGSGYPGAAVIAAIASATSTPKQLPLFVISAFIFLAVSYTVTAMLRRAQVGAGNLMAKLLVIVFGAIIGRALGIWDLWMIIILLIFALACAFASRQQTIGA